MRSKPVEEVLNKIAEAAFGRTPAATPSGSCVCHGEPVGEFRDDLSRREFAITGMCQRGQDDVFGEGE